MQTQQPEAQTSNSKTPRLGFLGVGWIGRHRMEAIAQSGAAQVAAIADPVTELAHKAKDVAPEAEVLGTLDDLLRADLDGIVIATPSALHAEQSIAALESGLAVFCQKPLARTAAETQTVVDAARRADRLLGVDLSYRYIKGVDRLRELVQSGELGAIYASNLVFHNAYGPDKAWFYDPALSGGGCVIDLGIHLVDLALWAMNYPQVTDVSGRLFAKGMPLAGHPETVEDYAVARLDMENGATAQLTCSWNLPAGREAVIEATFYGTAGGAALRNVNGSFYDFTVERYNGTTTDIIAAPPDEWGGRAAVAWARQLAEDAHFDPSIEHLVSVAGVLDRIYRR